MTAELIHHQWAPVKCGVVSFQTAFKIKKLQQCCGLLCGTLELASSSMIPGGRQSLGAAGHSNAAWQPGPGARGRSSPAYRGQLCRLREDKAIFIVWTRDPFLTWITTNTHKAFSGLGAEILEAKVSAWKESQWVSLKRQWNPLVPHLVPAHWYVMSNFINCDSKSYRSPSPEAVEIISEKRNEDATFRLAEMLWQHLHQDNNIYRSASCQTEVGSIRFGLRSHGGQSTRCWAYNMGFLLGSSTPQTTCRKLVWVGTVFPIGWNWGGLSQGSYETVLQIATTSKIRTAWEMLPLHASIGAKRRGMPTD